MANADEERFDLGRVIGLTFALTTRHFIAFMTLAVLFAGLPYGASLYAVNLFPDEQGLVQAFSLLVLLVGPLILQAALLRASVDDLSGAGVSLGRAIGAGFIFLLPLLGLGILMWLGIALGLVVLIVPGLILAVRWLIAPAVLVVEGEGILAAMGRGAELSANHRWAIFGLCVLYFVAYYVLLVTLSIVTRVDALDPIIGARDYVPLAGQIVLQAVVSVFGAVGSAAIYFELRRTKEGVNTSELASVFD